MAELAAKSGEFRKYHRGALLALALAIFSGYVASRSDLKFGLADHQQLGRIIVGFWAIVPPILFWIDGAFFLRYVEKDRRDIPMHLHDLGRNIWLALVAVLAALFGFTWP